MKNKIKFISLALAMTTFLFSCDSTPTVSLDIQSTKPGASTAAPSVQRSQSNRSAVAAPTIISVKNSAGVTTGEMVLTKALIAVKEIEIEMEGQDDEESEYTGTFLVDLLSNTVTPDFPVISLPGGKYDEIEMEIDKLDGTETDADGNPLVVATDDMFGRSLYLEGTYTPNGGTTQDFSLAFNTEEEIKLKDSDSVNSFAITGFTELLIAFRMDNWFDFSNRETNPDAVDLPTGIAISLDSATATGESQKMIEVIQENIEDSADFGEDSDGDGVLEEDEDDD
jgi:hypothetical protein